MNIQIEWVNTLKFIWILAVILWHINSPFWEFIFSWHMPLFFILSGFFIKSEKSILEFVKKDFIRLMIPYFIFAFIGLFLTIIKQYILWIDKLNILNETIGIIFWMDMNSLINHYWFVLWFLPALFISRFLVFISLKLIKNKIIISILAILLFFISFKINLPFALDNWINSFLWVFIGYNLYKFKNSKIFYLTPILFLFLYIYFWIPKLNLSEKIYWNIVLNIVWATSFTWSLIFLLKDRTLNNNINSIINLWWTNTMILFILHPYTNNIAYLIESIKPDLWYVKFWFSILLLYFILKLNIILKFKFIKKLKVN